MPFCPIALQQNTLLTNGSWFISFSLKELTHLGKSCQIYPNCMQKCLGRSTEHVGNFSKKCVLCDILKFKAFGFVMSFALRFLFYCTDFTADDLRWTTCACYCLGYCCVLVNRVYKPKCEETSLEKVQCLGTVFSSFRSRSTRQDADLSLPRVGTEAGRSRLLFGTVQQYNGLPPEVRSMSLGHF